MSAPTELERTSLEAHVDLCALRYVQLEQRLSTIESKVESLQRTIEKSSLNTIKVLIGTAGTVIVAILSVLGVIISKAPL